MAWRAAPPPPGGGGRRGGAPQWAPVPRPAAGGAPRALPPPAEPPRDPRAGPGPAPPVGAHKNAFDVGHRPAEDSHPLALLQIGVEQRRKTGTHHASDRLDFLLRNHRPLVPSLAEDAHEPPRLADLDVAVLVQRIVEEEVAGEHRNVDPVSEAAATRPDFDRGKKGMRSEERRVGKECR